MKKEYTSPEVEMITLLTTDVLAASTYSAVPEDPTKFGNDDDDIEFGD